MFRGPRVPITSVGLVNCLGQGRDAIERALAEQATFLHELSLFQDFATKPYVGVVGHVHLAAAVPEMALSARPRQARLALAALGEVEVAVRAAVGRYGAERVGLVLGTSTGGIGESERAYAELRRRATLPGDYSFEQQHAFHAVVELVAEKLGLWGPAYVVSTACSSSAKALASAGRLIATGSCDAVLVGGVDSLCLTTLRGFQSLGVMDATACRPFAAERNGINIGEGAAFLLLERSGRASVALVSVGETSDAHHMTQPHPEGSGAEAAMQQALSLGGVEAREVGYVNAHGTGTKLNDQAEAAAIARIFGAAVPVSSTKWLTGHMLGAAGASEAVLTALAIERARLPGNGPSEPALEFPIQIAGHSMARSMKYALSNSLAFGGSNSSVLLGKQQGVQGSPVLERAPSTRPVFELLGAVKIPAPGAVPRAAGELLGSRVRGRASSLTLMFTELLEALAASGFDAKRSPVVYGSAFGEMATTMELLELELERGESSPLRFQHSVHNTAAGLLSIATGNTGFTTSIAAGYATFAMSLLEGLTYLEHTGAEHIAVLVAEEASVVELGERRYPASAAGFYFGRVARAVDAVRASVNLPVRVRGEPAAVRGGAEPIDQNPVSDALKLVEAFQAGPSQTIVLGEHGPESCSRWAIDFRRASGRENAP